jgi:hypothetical protein
MSAVRRITRAELEKRLNPYKCVFLKEYPSGFELWETGWDEPFTLWSDDGYYDEWQYFQLLASVIAKSMPPDWNGR